MSDNKDDYGALKTGEEGHQFFIRAKTFVTVIASITGIKVFPYAHILVMHCCDFINDFGYFKACDMESLEALNRVINTMVRRASNFGGGKGALSHVSNMVFRGILRSFPPPY